MKLITWAIFTSLSVGIVGAAWSQPVSLKTGGSGFRLDLRTEYQNETPFLVADIWIEEGSWVVSPFSEDGIYGNFSLTIADTKVIFAEGPPSEIPESVPEFDGIVNSPVRFVRGKATYKQKLQVATSDDFEVPGAVWFVLEPSCVPYQIDFTVAQRAGQIMILDIKAPVDARTKRPKGN
ncbi:MAG: hypothetical protein D6714_14995 [Bacteroidetes bacterium]|nr:MAG: hypothetical protein D6714_14995 [Bacteroidota bacterium]